MHKVDIALENLDECYKLDYVAKQACGSVWYETKKTVMLACVAIDYETRQEGRVIGERWKPGQSADHMRPLMLQ